MARKRGLHVVGACSLGVALLLSAASAVPVRAQDVTANEQRLVDIHSLLLDLAPVQAPGALAPGQLDLGLEITGIPVISGDVGPKREITASDHTRLYPRPRLALGLPLPAGLRAFVGVGYIPPVEVQQVTVDSLGAEGGIAWAHGPLRLGLQGHGGVATARSPVTSPDVRDRLKVTVGGWDVRAGYELRWGTLSVTPYAGGGQVWTTGDFRSSVDGGTVHSTRGGAAYYAGARVLFREHWEGVLEYSVYPDRLWNPRVRVGYVVNLW